MTLVIARPARSSSPRTTVASCLLPGPSRRAAARCGAHGPGDGHPGPRSTPPSRVARRASFASPSPSTTAAWPTDAAMKAETATWCAGSATRRAHSRRLAGRGPRRAGHLGRPQPRRPGPAVRRHDLVDRALLVAAGSGYWRHNQPAIRSAVPFFFRVDRALAIRAAATTRAAGWACSATAYRRDRQWARWCLQTTWPSTARRRRAGRRAHAPDQHPVTFTDDGCSAETSMQALEALYIGTPSRRRTRARRPRRTPDRAPRLLPPLRPATPGSSTRCCSPTR